MFWNPAKLQKSKEPAGRRRYENVPPSQDVNRALLRLFRNKTPQGFILALFSAVW
jgi:hypothetical protein